MHYSPLYSMYLPKNRYYYRLELNLIKEKMVKLSEFSDYLYSPYSLRSGYPYPYYRGYSRYSYYPYSHSWRGYSPYTPSFYSSYRYSYPFWSYSYYWLNFPAFFKFFIEKWKSCKFLDVSAFCLLSNLWVASLYYHKYYEIVCYYKYFRRNKMVNN